MKNRTQKKWRQTTLTGQIHRTVKKGKKQKKESLQTNQKKNSNTYRAQEYKEKQYMTKIAGTLEMKRGSRTKTPFALEDRTLQCFQSIEGRRRAESL